MGLSVCSSLSDSGGSAGNNGPYVVGLHTSLLIPTFHLGTNHAVMFWHKHSSYPQQRSWGYSTISRMQAPDWMRELEPVVDQVEVRDVETQG